MAKPEGVDNNLTPMMRQFFEIKEKYKEYIVFFRMGDFYEMFEKDAEIASKILNIVLTKRAGVKMCGVPYHSYKMYLQKLIDAGKKVVICEQLEDPKKSKGIVKRGVVEVITPGTIVSEEFLKTENNFILSIYESTKNKFFISWADISTGDFYISNFNKFEDFIEAFYKIKPKEVLLTQNLYKTVKLELEKAEITPLEITVKDEMHFKNNKNYIENFVKNFFNINSLNVFGIKSYVEIVPSIALIEYFKENEIINLEHLKKIKKIDFSNYMTIDKQTFKNLEILEPLFFTEKGSTLFEILNNVKTSSGLRKLKEFLNFPLKDLNAIQKRVDDVEFFYKSEKLLNSVIDILKKIKDIVRLETKLLYERISPTELVEFKRSIFKIIELKKLLESYNFYYLDDIEALNEYAKLIDSAIIESGEINTEKGIIQDGYDSELDKLKYMEKNSKNILIEYQENEKQKTGIQNLRIKYNKVFGYFFEVTKGNLNKVPDYFIRKQTLTNTERFTTEKLIQIETELKDAKEKRKLKEEKLFKDIVNRGKDLINEIQKLSNKIGYIDVIVNFANISLKYKWVKPKLNTDGILEIINGRHPVIEITSNDDFIPNSLKMDSKKRFHIITGPNMSGKSTFLRQNALIIFLAHIGSFVPADFANIQITDKLFSRVGASDNITRGESTFLVEMSETANILNNATKHSFVILDEVGRGTATFDGMSLAYAISEFLIEKIKSKVLFATHYHELTLLYDRFKENVENYRTVVKEWNNKIIFLKRLEKGSINKSYGIYVAKLAGIPDQVIKRAEELLQILEKNEIRFEYTLEKTSKKNHKTEKKEKLLFDPVELEKKRILDILKKININDITPIEAINLLNEIKKDLEKIEF